MKKNPKITIVTACYNSQEYLEDCILSVMRQTYPHIEHIIVDGGSTDGTLEIIRKYENQYPMKWISEKDNGMYDAITKGFGMATGDIYAWLNSDDMYMPWACEIVAAAMAHTEAQWVTGLPGHYNAHGVLHNIPRIAPAFPRRLIAKGYMDGRIASFLQQESMFWSKALWDRHGSLLAKYKVAGDYHLWKAFAQTQRLYTIDSVISGFRIHEGQKSADRDAYYREAGQLTGSQRLLAKTKLVKIACLVYSLLARKTRIRMGKFVLEEALNDE